MRKPNSIKRISRLSDGNTYGASVDDSYVRIGAHRLTAYEVERFADWLYRCKDWMLRPIPIPIDECAPPKK